MARRRRKKRLRGTPAQHEREFECAMDAARRSARNAERALNKGKCRAAFNNYVIAERFVSAAEQDAGSTSDPGFYERSADNAGKTLSRLQERLRKNCLKE